MPGFAYGSYRTVVAHDSGIDRVRFSNTDRIHPGHIPLSQLLNGDLTPSFRHLPGRSMRRHSRKGISRIIGEQITTVFLNAAVVPYQRLRISDLNPVHGGLDFSVFRHQVPTLLVDAASPVPRNTALVDQGNRSTVGCVAGPFGGERGRER